MGFIKKVAIADNCGPLVDAIFQDYEHLSGGILILGAVLFAFQIYGDFSGYSDIAIGTAKLFGIRLMTNFSTPYFSRSIAEFWRRWHISLSTWFRDYLYIPLGGSKVNTTKAFRNVMIIFLVSGFWHGANWTFIIWGLLHALFFVPLLFLKMNRNHRSVIAENQLFPNVKEIVRMTYTYYLVSLSWVFFRSNSVTDAFAFSENMLVFKATFMSDLLNYGKG